MSSYLYAKWRDAPADCPVEFYSEIDADRWETRKVEVFADGRLGHAPAARLAGDTRLSIVPLPALAEIAEQVEFEAREISAADFEATWHRATQAPRA
jgi:hypothetical protein